MTRQCRTGSPSSPRSHHAPLQYYPVNVTYDATRMNINYPFLAVLINRTMITVSQHSINLFLFGTKYSFAKLILLEDNAKSGQCKDICSTMFGSPSN